MKKIVVLLVLALFASTAFALMSSVHPVRAAVPGDVNGDGKVDVFDVILVARSFGSHLGQPNYNPAADLNNDTVIDIFDALIVAANFGQGS